MHYRKFTRTGAEILAGAAVLFAILTVIAAVAIFVATRLLDSPSIVQMAAPAATLFVGFVLAAVLAVPSYIANKQTHFVHSTSIDLLGQEEVPVKVHYDTYEGYSHYEISFDAERAD